MSEMKFSISDIQEVATESSEEFCYARICVLSTKPNSHQVLITDEILRRDGVSVRGKWIVCDFDGYDATTHTPHEKIIGIVPNDAKIDFVEQDGYTLMYVDAVISKIYAKEVYDMFKIDNFRNVSVEMMTADEQTLPNGDIPIKGLKIVGITVLGRQVNGSCPDANMTIIQFSEKDAEKYYNKQFAKDKAITLANELIDFANSIKEKEFSIEDTLIIKDTEKEDIMLEQEKNLSESENKEEKDIVMEEPNKEIEEPKKEDEVEMAECEEANKDEVEMAEDEKEEKKSSEEEMGCDKEMGCEKMSEDSEDEEKDEKEKKFSLDAYLDQSVIVDMLEKETEASKELVNQVINEFSAEEIVKKFVEILSENNKLMAEKIINDLEKQEKKLSAIMASVKEDLDEKTFSELSQEGKELTLEQLGAFENKVKAFAYEATKNNKNIESESEDIMKFGAITELEQENCKDVFERISKM